MRGALLADGIQDISCAHVRKENKMRTWQEKNVHRQLFPLLYANVHACTLCATKCAHTYLFVLERFLSERGDER